MLCLHICAVPDGFTHHTQTYDSSTGGNVRCTTNPFHSKSKFQLIRFCVGWKNTPWQWIYPISFQIPLDKFFIIILLCCDIMCLNFLFLVKNTGSWLEIGTSISHFVIMDVTVVVLCLIQIFAKFLTTYQLQSLLRYGRTRDLSADTLKIE